MEVDSNAHQFDEINESMSAPGGEDIFGSADGGGVGSIMKDLMKSVPGIDEGHRAAPV